MNPISAAWATLKAATARLTMRWSRASSFGLTWLAGNNDASKHGKIVTTISARIE